MTTLELLHTCQLDAAARAQLRQLLGHSFTEFSEHDWDHALGGMHAIARDGDALIGHGSVVQRRLLHQGRALRCGYVEAVAVASTHRRRGLGARIMKLLGTVITSSYEVGGLSASEDGRGVYSHAGWLAWRGSTHALTPGGVIRTTEDDDSIMVLPVTVELDRDADITCDWRDGSAW